MPRPLTFNAALAKEIVDSRRIGSTVREAFAAAGVPKATASEWLTRGRLWNSNASTDASDERFAAFARDFDAARSVYLRSLRAYRANGVQVDPRLAHEVLKHEETKELRNQELRLLKQRVRVETNRAEGTHVETVRHVGDLADDELDRRIAELEAQRTTH